MPTSVITANRLEDGAVVWRDVAGCWLVEIDRAVASDDEETIAGLMSAARADEAAGIVIAPYEVEIDVAAASGGIRPIQLRERIRAGGPTVRLN